MSLPPIPSDRPGASSRFKGVFKDKKKWKAYINILSEGGNVRLGTFDSEEEAGIMFARARYKYPVPTLAVAGHAGQKEAGGGGQAKGKQCGMHGGAMKKKSTSWKKRRKK